MVSFVRGLRTHVLWVAVASAMLALLVLALWASAQRPAHAAKAGSCDRFSVFVNGEEFRGDQDRTIAPPISSIEVRGTFKTFDVRPHDLAVLDYFHTGARSSRPDKNLPGPFLIFESKVPNHGETLTSPLGLGLSNEGVVLERSGGGQDMKIQAKDCPQGGLFQMEPEPGVTETNTLGDGFTYENGVPGQDSPLCFTNGVFSGFDSPEIATLVSSTDRVATWRVAAGGRVGMVIGEDAVEEGCRP